MTCGIYAKYHYKSCYYLYKLINKSISQSPKRHKNSQNNTVKMLLDINQFNGSRRDIRLNEVNWSLVVTLLLGNSGYQTNKNITKVRLHSASDPRKSNI